MNNTLPPLAFGGRTARPIKCPIEAANHIKGFIKGLTDYESLAKPNEFISQSSVVNINGLALAASANTPTQFKSSCKDIVLIIPMAGSGSASAGGSAYNYRAGENAVMLSKAKFTSVNSTISALIMKINEDKILQTTRNMLGVDADKPLTIDLYTSREISLNFGKISFDTIFRQYANLINQFYGDPQLLNKSGIDDGIYSAIAMMLHPALLMGNAHTATDVKYDKRLLDRTCQYIQANLTSPITLTMLDQVSSMSRRKLHYAFQFRYGCTPMQWVRDERLMRSLGIP
jgi:hypothetical protein